MKQMKASIEFWMENKVRRIYIILLISILCMIEEVYLQIVSDFFVVQRGLDDNVQYFLNVRLYGIK